MSVKKWRRALLNGVSRRALMTWVRAQTQEAKRILNDRKEGIYLTICGDEAFDSMVAKDRLAEISDGSAKLVTGAALKSALDSLLS